jgi:hypothetical protein
MSAPELTRKLSEAIGSNRYDVIICNVANPDMVGHTGDLAAAIRAVEAVDRCMASTVQAIEAAGGELLITADHGNVEQMRDASMAKATPLTPPIGSLVFHGRQATLSDGTPGCYRPCCTAGLPPGNDRTVAGTIQWVPPARERTLRSNFLLTLLLSLAIQPLLLTAWQDASSTMDQDEVEHQLALLKQGIAELRARMEQSRAEHRAEQAQLRALDLAIQSTVRELRELERTKALYVNELALLESQREQQSQALRGRQAQLGKQIESTYHLASQSRLKLVLNQDSPAQLSRSWLTTTTSTMPRPKK